MDKHSHIDDEIPLTNTGATRPITLETRARFDSLLRSALNQAEKNAKEVHQKEENMVENSKISKKQPKKSILNAKGTRKHGDGKVLSTNPEESSHNVSAQMLSGINFLSNSDDDVVVQEKCKDHLQIDNKGNSKRSNSINNERQELLKDERNANKDETYVTDLSKENGEEKPERRRIHSDAIKKNSEYSPQKRTIEVPLRNSDHVSSSFKKPVPLPRKKTQKKSTEQSKSPDIERVESSVKSKAMSSSLSPLLPLDQLIEAQDEVDDGDDDSDACVVPQNIKRKDKKKKGATNSNEKQEHTELKTLHPEEKKGTVSRRKSSYHKSRRKSKEEKVETSLTAAREEENQPSGLNYDKIIGIFIHRSECLQIDPLVRHPLVKVHLLDAATGNYLKKSNNERSVSFYYENREVDYILPLMTEVFDFKERRSLVPFWEELLVFNEDFEYILQDKPSVLILFEILDFVNFSVASSQYRKLGPEGGWHHIAWAFLRPVGANGILNTEKQVRLQLYKPQQAGKSNCNGCDVYHWWNSRVWKRYPATLYVTVKGITPPEHLPRVLRSRSALQGELSQSPSFLDLDQIHDDNEEAKSEIENSMASAQLLAPTAASLPEWSRLPSQSCKIPNHRRLTLPTASRGCFFVKFSNSGLYLACSVADEEKFFIIVYSIPGGKECVKYVGHQGLVYDLCWSSKDTMLLSASADWTACLWDTDFQKSGPLQMLPHPSFLYCAKFHPGNSSLLVTGCCDHVVRVWIRLHKSTQFELAQELEGHTGFVSAVTMSSNGIIYSGDSAGRIIEWQGTKGKSKKLLPSWRLNRNIDIRELRDTVINSLNIHPGGRRLLAHARDSRLRMLDIATASVIQWFNGALNHRVQTSACTSPCGGMVLAASEDGTVHVWNADTGDQLAIYSGLQFNRGASGVDYHPYEHMTAFTSYGSPANIVLCDYDKLASGKDIGLVFLHHQDMSAVGTLQSSENQFKNSASLVLSNTESGLLTLKKINKKIITGQNNKEAVTSTPFKDGRLLTSQTSPSSISGNSTNIVSPWKGDDGEASDLKLASIIEKIDQVLSRTPSKTSQISEMKHNS
ncbi:jouberin-like [Periplaneta americana]|uniref:jouberin-like n=1 Tax=Periplaneta americana TaxID=6978 RepID=UPI0037E8AEBE